jgi:voltage-gated potassium channel
MGKIKRRVYEILEVASPSDKASRIFDIFIITLIFLNVIAIILETIEKLSLQLSTFFRIFEIFSVIIFTIEYIFRVWSYTENPKYKKPIIGRIKFIFTPLALIDLFAILPFYLPMFIPFDLRFMRAVRLIRLFRLFKMGRYSESMKLFAKVFKAKKEELFIAVFAVFILLTISSSLLYYVETEAQPEAFSSIPAAMWWGVTTLTTVGYGDVYPITSLGKFLGAIISLLGVGLFALPTGILSAGFVEEIRKRREGAKVCPHCGEKID